MEGLSEMFISGVGRKEKELDFMEIINNSIITKYRYAILHVFYIEKPDLG